MMTWKRAAIVVATAVLIALAPSIVRAIKPFLTVGVEYQPTDMPPITDGGAGTYVENGSNALKYYNGSSVSTCCGGGGSGTVTSVACGAGLSCAPSPIVGAGTASVSTAQGQSMAPTDNTYAYGDATHRLTGLGAKAIVSGTTALSLTSNMANSSTNTGPYTDTTTALTTGRHYWEARNGGTPQWCGWTSAGGDVSLEACTGSTSQMLGNGTLVVADSAPLNNYVYLTSNEAALLAPASGSHILLNSATTTQIYSQAADGASAVALTIHNNNTWANAAAEMLAIDNNGTVVLNVHASGVAELGVSSGAAVAGGLRYDGTNVQICTDGATWEPVAVLDKQQDFTKDQGSQDIALTDAATVAVDCTRGNTFTLLLTGSGHTMGNPTGCKGGHTYQFLVKQAAGGGDTLLWDTKYLYSGGTAPTQTATADKTDIYSCTYLDGPDKMYCVWVGNF